MNETVRLSDTYGGGRKPVVTYSNMQYFRNKSWPFQTPESLRAALLTPFEFVRLPSRVLRVLLSRHRVFYCLGMLALHNVALMIAIRLSGQGITDAVMIWGDSDAQGQPPNRREQIQEYRSWECAP